MVLFAFALGRENFFRLDYAIHTEIGRQAMNGDFSRTTDRGYLEVYEKIQAQSRGLVSVATLPKAKSENLVPVFYIDPGYGVQAGIVWKLLGFIDWRPLIVLQLLLDAAMVFFLYGIGTALGKPTIGLWLAGLHAVFILEIQQALVPHYDIYISFYYITVVYLLLKEQKANKLVRSLSIVAMVGLLSAYVSWIRSTAAFFPFFIVLYLFILKRNRNQLLKAIVLIAVFGLFFALPRAIYNLDHFGRFDIVRGCKWWNIYTGLGQFSNPFGLVGTDGDAVRYVKSVNPTFRDDAPPGVLDYRLADEVIKPHCIRLIRDHPAWYIKTCLKRAAFVAFPGFYFHTRFILKDESEKTWFSSYLSVLKLGWYGIMFSLLIWSLLFLYGAYLGLRQCLGTHLGLMLPFVYSVASIAPMFLQHRSITNIYFIQIFLGVFAIQQLAEKKPWRLLRERASARHPNSP